MVECQDNMTMMKDKEKDRNKRKETNLVTSKVLKSMIMYSTSESFLWKLPSVFFKNGKHRIMFMFI